jgi:dipeptidyl-peptidase-3
MRTALDALTRFYRTGERADRLAHDIAWVAAGAEVPSTWSEDATAVDTINGFVDVGLDPRGLKGAWEGLVFCEDPRRARAIQTIAERAQWFEDHLPIEERFRRPAVGSASARSVDVLIATGDAGPLSAPGVHLPNDASIREEYGSRSFRLANVAEALEQSTPKPLRVEFAWDQAEIEREERWGSITAELLTDLREVAGHGSGRQAAERRGDPARWLKEYGSALEEARADLVALYFIMDEELVRLGLLADVGQAALAAYEHYTRHGGLVQLRCVRSGVQLEQDPMRGRQLVVRWIQDNSSAIDERVRDDKHYLVVTDARAWREAAGRLLAIVQRIKSTGDYDAARDLFERYGIRFSATLRDEVVARCQALGLPSTTAFVMPRLTPVYDRQGEIADVALSYPQSLEQQMLEWSGRRTFPAQ